jgi:hypothetical protein
MNKTNISIINFLEKLKYIDHDIFILDSIHQNHILNTMLRLCHKISRDFNHKIRRNIDHKFIGHRFIGHRFIGHNFDSSHIRSGKSEYHTSTVGNLWSINSYPIDQVYSKVGAKSMDIERKIQIGDESIKKRNGFVKYCTFYKNGECHCPSLLSCIYNYDDDDIDSGSDFDSDSGSDFDSDSDFDANSNECFDIIHAVPNSDDNNGGNSNSKQKSDNEANIYVLNLM